MSRSNLEEFYQIVLKDRSIQERFKTCTDRNSMIALAVEIGIEQGYSFTMEEVQAYMDELNASSTAEENLLDEELEAIAGGGGNNCSCW